MLRLSMFLPALDADGQRFPEEHHVQFLECVVEPFRNCCFAAPLGKYQVVVIWGDFGLIQRSADLSGLINMAKCHYRVRSILVEYLGTSEVL